MMTPMHTESLFPPTATIRTPDGSVVPVLVSELLLSARIYTHLYTTAQLRQLRKEVNREHLKRSFTAQAPRRP